jgi:hypothetical protein
VPRVRLAKIGAQPGGSMITRKVTSADPNSSIISGGTRSSMTVFVARAVPQECAELARAVLGSTFQSQPASVGDWRPAAIVFAPWARHLRLTAAAERRLAGLQRCRTSRRRWPPSRARRFSSSPAS